MSVAVSIALFDEPARVSISVPELVDGSRTALLLGFLTNPHLQGILCLEDGQVTLLDTGMFTMDFRYDVESDTFRDHNMVKHDQGLVSD